MSDSSYEQRKQDLIEEITTAFDGVSRQGGVSLSEACVIDDYGSGFSQERIDVAWQTYKKNGIYHDLPENQARRALERYWGQFL